MSAKDMIKKSILESDMYSQAISTSTLLTIIADMAIALIMGIVIYMVYKKYFQGVIYSRTFGMTLVGMTILTCMVTLAISTNIVISLGMVGALSIVRYRTAVKEPADLLYLFWAITTGITVGASMYILAVIGAIIFIAMIMIFNAKVMNAQSYVMIVHFRGDAEKAILENIKSVRYALKSKVLRNEETEMTVQLSCKGEETSFVDQIKAIEAVKDVTLVQYHGEYHG
ncbi:MAG: DUF4956 domain-containing protein [Lachnospiraceae bacterium]|nr:DUF4956 domain-containing protein [Lachnospiraceae bacterium]